MNTDISSQVYMNYIKTVASMQIKQEDSCTYMVNYVSGGWGGGGVGQSQRFNYFGLDFESALFLL